MKDYRAEFPLEFCALHFLIQWLRSEKALHEAIKDNPSGESIRGALAYFQVARNFKGLKDPATVAVIRDSLLKIRNDQSLTTKLKVEALASHLQSHFQKFNLSAASKLLWLSYREPFIVYDNRTVVALKRKFKHKFAARNYTEYSNAWRAEYAKSELAIRAAIKQLPKGRMFMPACRLTDDELLHLAEETWFTERVFDTFLWEVGGDG